jgi:hypothetical protein
LDVFIHLEFYTFETAEGLDGLIGSRILGEADVQLWNFRSGTRTGVLDNDVDLHMSARI